jgi:hypothetical protein
MKHNARSYSEAQAAILRRMEASRAALLAANAVAARTLTSDGRASSSPASIIAALVKAPNVTLLLAVCIGGIVLGPGRTLGVVSRSGLTALIGRNVRQLIGR